jgi:hypothetical protein
MTNGYIIVARSRDTKGIYIETNEDLDDYADMRIIYCQAVCGIEAVQEKIDRWVDENDDVRDRTDDVNDSIAEMVSSMQWIANEHPIQSFRRLK